MLFCNHCNIRYSLRYTVIDATPHREFYHDARYQDQNLNARVVGVHPNYASANRLELAQGRFIQPGDLKYLRNVCVIGSELAEKLFRHQSPLGRSVQVANQYFFRIIGVSKYRTPSAGVGSSLASEDFNRDIYIPLTSDRARIGEELRRVQQGSYVEERLELSQITIQVNDVDDVKPTAQTVEGLLSKTHKQKDFAIVIPLDLLEQAKAAQRIFSVVLGSTAAISLLVGGIGIMNIMLASVSERTREIGIRRALGARQRDIVSQFLFETLVLSGVGTIIGLAIGLAAPQAVSWISGMRTEITVWSVLVAVLVSFGVGMAFGIYPARAAAKLDPIEALRRA